MVFAQIQGNAILKINIEYHHSITKISYVYKNHHVIANELIFKSLDNSINSSYCLLEAVQIYMDNLSKCEAEVIFEAYHKHIRDGFVIDGFITGLATYMVFIDLLDRHELDLPFEFNLPYNLNSLYAVNRNMFKYVIIILTTLSKIECFSFINYILEFINIWEPLFVLGPNINYAELSLSIISGFSDHVLNVLLKTERKCQKLAEKLLKQEQEHYLALQSIQCNMQQEFDLMISETKKNLLALPMHIDSYVLERVHKTLDAELQLPSKQQLINLEHRVENLYEVIKTKL